MKLKDLAKKTSSISVLYIEDDKYLRLQNAELFKTLFKSVDLADNGLDAIRLYEKNRYNLIITDINIPNINGIDVIKKIKKQNPKQAILITTVFNKSEWEKELNTLGSYHYLTKPLKTDTLLRAIEDILATI